MKKGPYFSAKRRRPWTPEEDLRLRKCVEKHGQCNWHLVPSRAGIERCRKSCRMRWLNYLCPNIKRGEFGDDEDDLIFRLHKLLGNRWSLIAGRLPGRTANDVKNHWNCHLGKKVVAASENATHIDEKVQVIKPQPRIPTKDIQNFGDPHRPENEKGMLLMTPPRPPDKPVRRWESSLSNEEEENTVFPRDVDEVVQQLPSGNSSWFEGMKLDRSPAEGTAFAAEGCDLEIFSTCEDFYPCDWFDS